MCPAMTSRARVLVPCVIAFALSASACTPVPPQIGTLPPSAVSTQSSPPSPTNTVFPGLQTLIAKWATEEAAPTQVPAKPTQTPSPAVVPTGTPVVCSVAHEVRLQESAPVYAAAFSHANQPQRHLVLSDQPALEQWDIEWLSAKAQQDPLFLEPYLAGISAQTLAGFIAANSSPISGIAANLPFPHEALTSTQIDRLLGEDLASGWKRFEAKYPDSMGYWAFSQVGFDCELNQALVFLRHVYGYAGMTGTFYLLTRDTGEWEVEHEFLFSEA
jgi:hypothetical protein